MEEVKEKLYTRAQLLRDKGFAEYRDILKALMAEDESLSLKAINKRITSFLSRKTK